MAKKQDSFCEMSSEFCHAVVFIKKYYIEKEEKKTKYTNSKQCFLLWSSEAAEASDHIITAM